jgi:tetratricopeptide (TPR) repeat protein
LDPENPQTLSNRAQSWLALGDRQRALDDFDAAIRADPEFIDAYAGRAELWLLEGEFERAIEELNLVIRSRPRGTALLQLRGRTWARIGDQTRAIADFSTVIRLDPRNGEAYNQRAWSRYLEGTDHQQAFEDAQMAFRLLGEDPEALNTVAHIVAAAGDPEKALDVFDRVAELSDIGLIARYQTTLTVRGYYTDTVDGIYDAATRRALAECMQAACNAWSPLP